MPDGCLGSGFHGGLIVHVGEVVEGQPKLGVSVTYSDINNTALLIEIARQTDADVVVREGLAALEKGKDEYTSGRLYRFLVPVLRQRWMRGLLGMLGVKL